MFGLLHSCWPINYLVVPRRSSLRERTLADARMAMPSRAFPFVASQVDRESRILSDAYPYIASRLLTDSAPELQGALQQLLFKDGKPR